jgi:alpha-galactosidase
MTFRSRCIFLERHMKIAFIGAGSVIFSRNLINDVLSFPALQDSTLSLMDIDSGRLDLIRSLTERIVSERGLPTVVEATTDRRRALDGADYVVVMIQVGGLEPFEHDIAIPLRYGIDQSVGDSLGPGGVFRGLRTVPVLVDIARDMERLCPNAWMLQYSNPMAINTWSLYEAADITVVGLCHSVQGTAKQLAGYFDLDFDRISYWCAGINHMSWYLRYEYDGEDAYPILRTVFDRPEIFEKDKTRFEVMRHFDYYVTESTHHMSEYTPYFRRTPELVEQFATPRWDYLELCKNGWQNHYDEVRRQAAGEIPVIPERSNEYASVIINARETDEPARINGNVRNTGLITNLPDGCCVEVPIFVDKTGLHPAFVGDLPPQLAALNRTNINVQELAVQSALEGDARKAFQAAALDPLTSSLLDLRTIQKMVDDLFAAHKAWLPQFGG